MVYASSLPFLSVYLQLITVGMGMCIRSQKSSVNSKDSQLTDTKVNFKMVVEKTVSPFDLFIN